LPAFSGSREEGRTPRMIAQSWGRRDRAEDLVDLSAPVSGASEGGDEQD